MEEIGGLMADKSRGLQPEETNEVWQAQPLAR